MRRLQLIAFILLGMTSSTQAQTPNGAIQFDAHSSIPVIPVSRTAPYSGWENASFLSNADTRETYFPWQEPAAGRIPDFARGPEGNPLGEGDGGGGDGGSGAGAGDAVNPGAPLSQIQFQNVFIPESYQSSGYSNQFILQPVFSVNRNPGSFFD